MRDLDGEESPCHTYVFYTAVHLLVNPIQESTAGHAQSGAKFSMRDTWSLSDI